MSRLPNRHDRCRFGSPGASRESIDRRLWQVCDIVHMDPNTVEIANRAAREQLAKVNARQYARTAIAATSLANGQGQLCENCASRIRHLPPADNERNHADKIAIVVVRRGIFAFLARDPVLAK
ncbi:MAG TPA: hypothetical protein VKE26_06280 [Xanthobacteraceae bacterium]|nr:hypothetical protein [Xanthobacteraceae bacterium]